MFFSSIFYIFFQENTLAFLQYCKKCFSQISKMILHFSLQRRHFEPKDPDPYMKRILNHEFEALFPQAFSGARGAGGGGEGGQEVQGKRFQLQIPKHRTPFPEFRNILDLFKIKGTVALVFRNLLRIRTCGSVPLDYGSGSCCVLR